MPKNNDAILLFWNGHSFRISVTSLEIQNPDSISTHFSDFLTGDQKGPNSAVPDTRMMSSSVAQEGQQHQNDRERMRDGKRMIIRERRRSNKIKVLNKQMRKEKKRLRE